ncbi:heme lyase CcmF/NrfE family subunit [Deinococcus sp. Marseille-Q6407]|uniref:heme lyase CcmF/NrfE family subunit n=1 Tax=Deinococcus sp. Marseille-Q6407 TaxID=2969223 RepID=UPI0021C1912D|nr:heme lyase CcmF/NrfE family subunit [Deinococcus sp. Marseille-Q6407]
MDLFSWYALSFSQSPLALLGQLSLLLALLFGVGGLWQAVVGGRTGDPRATQSASRAIVAVFGFVTISIGALLTAMIGSDFSVRYVAEHSMSTSPLWIRTAGLWGALEGSIMLWLWLLSLYALILTRTARRDALRPWVFGAMLFSLLFFLGVCTTIASPFTPLATIPAQGAGPNPALQNHWMMAVHPVLLYLGFVGLSVPFAYAVAALITGRLSEHWVSTVRRWTLVAWGFLTLGIVSGGWWSYETLGWGGYWAWDPVENASFIPWLLTTAFLHSIQIQERRGLMKGWNVWLIVLAYASTVLGTFLNRSGIVQSVHAFAGGPVGGVFFGFLAVLLLGGIALTAWRTPRLRDQGELPGVVSREGAFLAGNWLFLVFAFMVTLGTLFPTLIEATQGHRDTSVGAPFYNAFAVPLSLGLLLLMGIGPLLPWRRAEGASLWQALRPLLIAGGVAALVAAALGIRHPGVLATIALAAYNLVGLGLLIARQWQERQAAGLGGSFVGLIGSQPRRYGAYLAHIGLVMVALGIVFSTVYRQDAQATLNLNQPKTLLHEQLELTGTRAAQRSDGHALIADVRIDGRPFEARMNFYQQAGNMAFPAPAVRYSFLGDTYLVVTAFDEKSQWASVRLIESPLIAWLWWGTAVMMLGTGISLVSPRRPRLPEPAAARPGLHPAPAAD